MRMALKLIYDHTRGFNNVKQFLAFMILINNIPDK